MLKSGNFQAGSAQPTAGMPASYEYNSYTTEELLRDLKRDMENLKREMEEEKEGGGTQRKKFRSKAETSQESTGRDRECPVCKKAPCQVFEPKKGPSRDTSTMFASYNPWAATEQGPGFNESPSPSSGPTDSSRADSSTTPATEDGCDWTPEMREGLDRLAEMIGRSTGPSDPVEREQLDRMERENVDRMDREDLKRMDREESARMRRNWAFWNPLGSNALEEEGDLLL